MITLKCRVNVQWVQAVTKTDKFGLGCYIADYSVVSDDISETRESEVMADVQFGGRWVFAQGS
jgi:hypothetical protein